MMFYQIFLSPQLKRSVIISNKLVHKLSQLPNDLRLRKVENNVNTSWKFNLVPSLLPQTKILLMLAKDSLKIEIELFPYF